MWLFFLIKGESVHDVVEDGEFGDGIVQESAAKKEVSNKILKFSAIQRKSSRSNSLKMVSNPW